MSCGAALSAAGTCESCAPSSGSSGLRVLPGGATSELTDSPQVRLVRQLKMSTTRRHRPVDPAEMAEDLPAAMRSVETAVVCGDLKAADELLDSTLGSVLAGPGHGKSAVARAFLPRLLWIFCGILGLLFLWSLLL